MVGPGALKPKVGDGIESRRPLSAPVLHSFIPSSLFFFCLLLHLYWCVNNNNHCRGGARLSHSGEKSRWCPKFGVLLYMVIASFPGLPRLALIIYMQAGFAHANSYVHVLLSACQ